MFYVPVSCHRFFIYLPLPTALHHACDTALMMGRKARIDSIAAARAGFCHLLRAGLLSAPSSTGNAHRRQRRHRRQVDAHFTILFASLSALIYTPVISGRRNGRQMLSPRAARRAQAITTWLLRWRHDVEIKFHKMARHRMLAHFLAALE